MTAASSELKFSKTSRADLDKAIETLVSINLTQKEADKKISSMQNTTEHAGNVQDK